MNNYIQIYKNAIDDNYCEELIEKFESEILGINEPIKVVNEDINNLNLKTNGDFPYVDGLLFGFPCNDFSNVGETKGLDGNYGPLYSYGVKYINKNNPKFIFAENVSGISSAPVFVCVWACRRVCGCRVTAVREHLRRPAG